MAANAVRVGAPGAPPREAPATGPLASPGVARMDLDAHAAMEVEHRGPDAVIHRIVEIVDQHAALDAERRAADREEADPAAKVADGDAIAGAFR